VKLEDLVNEIDSLGLPADQVLDFLATLYVAREIPYMLEDKTRPPPYPTQKLFRSPDKIVEWLQQYGLVLTGLKQTSTYGEFVTVRYYMLTEQGYELASQAYLQQLISVADKLRSLLESFPKRLVKILALSAIHPRTGEPGWLAVRVDGVADLKRAFDRATSLLEMLVAEPGELAQAYYESKRAYEDLRLALERLREARARVYRPQAYDALISRFLVSYAGRVHESALQVMSELSALKLAVRVPTYSSKGEYTGDEYRAPPELTHLLEGFSADADLSDLRRPFLELDLLLRALRGELTKRELLKAASSLGVSEEEIKAALEVMHEKGLTSRYNEKGAPESPAFIVLDEAGVLQEVKEALSALESMILGE